MKFFYIHIAVFFDKNYYSLSVSLDDVAVFFDDQFADNEVVFKVQGRSNATHIRVFGMLAHASVQSICQLFARIVLGFVVLVSPH